MMLYFMLIMSVITFVVYGVDKKKAIKHEWRIPEKVLLLLAFFGGGIGALLGMLVFHHKTHKPKFMILVPLFAVLYMTIFGILYSYGIVSVQGI